MPDFNFNPNNHHHQLKQLIRDLSAVKTLTPKLYQKIIKKYPKNKNSLFSKSQIITALRFFSPSNSTSLIRKIRMKPVRTLSGVVPVTLLTKPFPCPGKCIFCPNDKKMPKSYLSREPGAQRALANKFDPYHQVFSRLLAYHGNGHSTDKVELIILGGTWSAYPLAYKTWFIKRCFDALNSFQGRSLDSVKYTISGRASLSALNKVQLSNQTASSRCVGLSIETRPDWINQKEIIQLRRFGCTKVQLGLQTLSNKILRLNQRGHTVKQSQQAISLLRSAGFKIQVHWMANLYGSDLSQDKSDFIKLFSNPAYRPDELKIYPTALLKTAPLMDFYKQGLWQPYTKAQLLDLLTFILPQVPCYCRVSRIIRDFSAVDIIAGSTTSNLRQSVETQAKKIKEIRFREIGQRKLILKDIFLKKISYQTSIGKEIFLQFTTLNNQIAAFLRLSLPKVPAFIPELKQSALIRELHVYGQALDLNQAGDSQHLGLGKRLIAQAQLLAGRQGYQRLSVISAVGTKAYYKKLNFIAGPLYQHLKL